MTWRSCRKNTARTTRLSSIGKPTFETSKTASLPRSTRSSRHCAIRSEAARRREAALQASLDQLSERVAQGNTEEVKLRDLEREAEAGRRLLENFLDRVAGNCFARRDSAAGREDHLVRGDA